MTTPVYDVHKEPVLYVVAPADNTINYMSHVCMGTTIHVTGVHIHTYIHLYIYTCKNCVKRSREWSKGVASEKVGGDWGIIPQIH